MPSFVIPARSPLNNGSTRAGRNVPKLSTSAAAGCDDESRHGQMLLNKNNTHPNVADRLLHFVFRCVHSPLALLVPRVIYTAACLVCCFGE